MKRRLLNLLAILSLLLCAAAAVSWAASYRDGVAPLGDVPDLGAWVEHARGNVRFVLPLGRREVTGAAVIPFPPKQLGPGDSSTWQLGGFVRIPSPGGGLTIVQNPSLEESATARRFRATRMDELAPAGRFAGVAWRTGARAEAVDTDATPSASFRRWGSLVVPHPYLLAAAAAYPAWRGAGALRRRRRDRSGLCPRCGYDLTGNVSGVCPECGATAETPG